MKINVFLMVFAVLFSQAAWGDGNAETSNFSTYANAPIDNSSSPAKDDAEQMKAETIEAMKASGPAPALPAVSQDENPSMRAIPLKWQGCAIDSDCTAAVVDCVSWEPVNKSYLDKIPRDSKICSQSIDPGFQPQAVCLAKHCVTTEQTTTVSWQEWLNER